MLSGDKEEVEETVLKNRHVGVSTEMPRNIEEVEEDLGDRMGKN